jgi:hypothetical protein
MKMLDRFLHATRLISDRGVCQARTASDDLRELGFPAGGGRTAVEDKEEDDDPEAASKETDDAELDKDLDDEDDTSSERKGAKDETAEESDDEKETDWEKRFKGSQASYLEQKQRNDALEARLARMEQATRTPPATVDRTDPREETANRLAADLDQIPNDGNARKETIKKWVGTIEQTSEQAARRVLNEAEQAKKGYEEAATQMKAALSAKGLDPEVYFKFADEKVAQLKRTNLAWFDQIPGNQQFAAIADLVIADRNQMLGKKTKEANEALRDKANGVVGKGKNSVTKAKSGDKEDVPDRTFTQQQHDVRALRTKEGARRYAEAGR